jgi:hypothetical protein
MDDRWGDAAQAGGVPSAVERELADASAALQAGCVAALRLAHAMPRRRPLLRVRVLCGGVLRRGAAARGGRGAFSARARLICAFARHTETRAHENPGLRARCAQLA